MDDANQKNPTINSKNLSVGADIRALQSTIRGNAAFVNGETQGTSAATSTLGLQGQVLYAITDFAIKRAQQELLDALVTEWLDQLEQNPNTTAGLKLSGLFPTTYGLLKDPKAPLPLSDGVAWKGAIESDLRRVPTSLYEQLADAQVFANALGGATDLKRRDARLALFLGGRIAQSRDVIAGLNAAALQANLLSGTSPSKFSKTLVITAVLLNGLTYIDPDDKKVKLETVGKLLGLSTDERKAFLRLCVANSDGLLTENFKDVRSLFADTNEGRVNALINLAAQTLSVVRDFKTKADMANSNSSIGSNAAPAANSAAVAAGLIESGLQIIKTANDWMTLPSLNWNWVEESAKETVSAGPDVSSTIKLLEPMIQISRGVELQQYGEVVAGTVSLLDLLAERSNDACESKKIEAAASFIKHYSGFLADVLLAKDKEAVQTAIERAAEPISSYKAKYSNDWTFSLSLQPGLTGGIEKLGKTGLGVGMVVAPYLPIGFSLTHSFGKYSNWGLNLQAFDLGAVLSYRLSKTSQDDGTHAEELPDIRFEQLFSPGLFLNYHIRKTPIVVLGGYAYTAKLRGVTGSGLDERASSHRVSLGIAVDIPVFYFYHGKSKNYTIRP